MAWGREAGHPSRNKCRRAWYLPNYQCLFKIVLDEHAQPLPSCALRRKCLQRGGGTQGCNCIFGKGWGRDWFAAKKQKTKTKTKQAAHSLRRHYPGQVQRDFLSLHLSFRMNRAPEAERQKGKHPWCWIRISLSFKYRNTWQHPVTSFFSSTYERPIYFCWWQTMATAIRFSKSKLDWDVFRDTSNSCNVTLDVNEKVMQGIT